MDYDVPRDVESLDTITAGSPAVLQRGPATPEPPQGRLRRFMGDHPRVMENLNGLGLGVGTYLGARLLGNMCFDGIIQDGLVPVAAASLGSLVAHQKTPNGIARWLGVIIPPAYVSYEMAGYITAGLDQFWSGFNQHVARPLDHPVDTVKNTGKSIYNWFVDKLGVGEKAAPTVSQEKGFVEGVGDYMKDKLGYLRVGLAGVGTHYMMKLTRPVREKMLKKWDPETSRLSKVGRALGLRH